MRKFRVALFTIIIGVFVFMGASILVPAPVNAATAEACSREAGGFLSFPTWYKYLDPEFSDPDGSGGSQPGECKFNLPVDAQGKESITLAVAPVGLAIFEIILRLASLIAVGFIIYGGIQYIISQGEPERIKNARTTIINALIGMVITIFSSAIVNLIGNNIR